MEKVDNMAKSLNEFKSFEEQNKFQDQNVAVQVSTTNVEVSRAETSELVSIQFKDEFITFEEAKAQQYTVPSEQEPRFSVHEEREDTLRKTT